MSEPIAKGYVEIVADKAKFDDSLGKLGDGDASEKVGKGMGSNLAKGLAAAAAGAGAISFFKGAFAEAEDAQKVSAQTAAVLASTGGAAGVTAKAVDDLAGSISKMTGIDDEAIASSENLLLTFTDIKNTDIHKVFDRATQATVDMAAALGGDAASQAITLGKALNDPIAGISKLTKVGVTFTDSQKDQIKAMSEAGDVAGAQSVILDELAKEFGGSAAAQATGAMKMNVAWGNFQETIGTMLMPVLEKLMGWFTKIAVWLSEHKPVLIALGVIIGTGLVIAFAAWTAGIVAATIALFSAEGALAFVSLPLVALIVGIAALAAGLIWAYQNVDWFREAVDKVADVFQWIWNSVLSPFIGWLSNDFTGKLEIVGRVLLATFTFGISEVIIAFKNHWDDILAFVTGIPGKIGAAASGMWDGITNAFIGAINFIIRAWNSFTSKLGIPEIDTHIPGVGKVGGWSLGSAAHIDEIRGYKNGGMVPGPEGLAQLAIVHGGERVIPAGSGGGGRLAETINFNGIGRPRDVLTELSWAMATRGGRV